MSNPRRANGSKRDKVRARVLREENTCHLCGQWVDVRLPHGLPGSPEVDEVIPVELAGVTTFVQRSAILYAQAQGDYARLHTARASHLVRISLNALEERWGAYGFVRIHRSTLVSTTHITAVTVQGGRCKVRLDEDIELEVSRRHTRALRDRLIRSAAR